MAQGLVGADVTQLRRLAGEFDQAAADLERAGAVVSRGVQGACWVGPVAVRFRGSWQQTHWPRVNRTANDLKAAAQALRRNADQQEAASRSDGGVSGGAGGAGVPGVNGDTSPLSWWEHVLYFFDGWLGGEDHPYENANPNALNAEAFDPDNTSQSGFGDCALVSTINSIIESDAGDNLLRDNIRWDESARGYYVTLYENGQPVEVFVDNVFTDGSGLRMFDANNGVTNQQGLASLYEAAVYQRYGWDEISSGEWPVNRMELLTGRSATEHWNDLHQATVAAFTDPSVDNAVVASTWSPADHMGTTVANVQATRADGSTETVTLVGPHSYDVVGVDATGRVGLRNPWGQYNSADGGGVFYISAADFEQNFNNVAVMEVAS